MQCGPQYYLQTSLSMTFGNWVTKLYILGLSLYFIVALTAERFPFPAYKPAFRPGLFAFSAFVTKQLASSRNGLFAFSEEKRRFPKADKKKFFPLRGIPIGKPFLAILRFKNHVRLLQTFEQTIEQPQEGTFPLAAIFVYLHYRAVRRLNTGKPINQSDKSPLCFSKYGFSPDLGGKNGGVPSMRMQVILDSSFRPPGFSPYMGREERRVQGLD